MKYFDLRRGKTKVLKEDRNISFDEVVLSIANGDLLDVLEHPNKRKYPNQKILIVNMNEYAYIVPFVEHKEVYFLKTIYPSRKATRTYLNNED